MEKEVKLTLGMAELPNWLRLLPMGEVSLVDGRPSFLVDAESLAEVVQAFAARGTDLVIDYEHQSLKGGQAPAAGWIKDLEVREDGLWAQVEWTEQAEEYIRRREYRYFSPVLRLDPESRRPRELMNVGLTNAPAIRGLTPLVAKWGGEALAAAKAADLLEGNPTWAICGETFEAAEELKARLGLEAGTTGATLLREAAALLRDLACQLGLPAEAEASRIKGRVEALKANETDTQKLQTELTDLKARLQEETVNRMVEEALMAGKISPAQREWALSYCRQDPESFKTYVDKAPRVVPVGERLNLGEESGRKHQGLTPEELAVCRALNLAPEAYSQAKAAMAKAKKGGGDTRWQH